MTERRLYIETMERVLPDIRKYIIGTGEGDAALLNLINLDRAQPGQNR